jgi:hypothetical protein
MELVATGVLISIFLCPLIMTGRGVVFEIFLNDQPFAHPLFVVIEVFIHPHFIRISQS